MQNWKDFTDIPLSLYAHFYLLMQVLLYTINIQINLYLESSSTWHFRQTKTPVSVQTQKTWHRTIKYCSLLLNAAIGFVIKLVLYTSTRSCRQTDKVDTKCCDWNLQLKHALLVAEIVILLFPVLGWKQLQMPYSSNNLTQCVLDTTAKSDVKTVTNTNHRSLFI